MTRTVLVTIEAPTEIALIQAEGRLHNAVRWMSGVGITVRPASVLSREVAEAILTCACGDNGCATCRGWLS